MARGSLSALGTEGREGRGTAGTRARKGAPDRGFSSFTLRQVVPLALKRVMDLGGERLRKTLASMELCLDWGSSDGSAGCEKDPEYLVGGKEGKKGGRECRKEGTEREKGKKTKRKDRGGKRRGRGSWILLLHHWEASLARGRRGLEATGSIGDQFSVGNQMRCP